MALYTKIPGSGEGHAPIRVSADPRSGSGLAAKPGMWAYDGTYYYQATGTGVNDWIIVSWPSGVRAKLEERARILMGVPAVSSHFEDIVGDEVAISSHFNHYTGGTSAYACRTNTGGVARFTAAGADGRREASSGGSTAVPPIFAPGGAAGKWYCAARMAHVTSSDATSSGIGYQTAGGTRLLYLGTAGGVSLDTKFAMSCVGHGGGTAGTVDMGAKDTNWHTFEAAAPGDGKIYAYLDYTLSGSVTAHNVTPGGFIFGNVAGAGLTSVVDYDWVFWAWSDAQRS